MQDSVCSHVESQCSCLVCGTRKRSKKGAIAVQWMSLWWMPRSASGCKLCSWRWDKEQGTCKSHSTSASALWPRKGVRRETRVEWASLWELSEEANMSTPVRGEESMSKWWKPRGGLQPWTHTSVQKGEHVTMVGTMRWPARDPGNLRPPASQTKCS